MNGAAAAISATASSTGSLAQGEFGEEDAEEGEALEDAPHGEEVEGTAAQPQYQPRPPEEQQEHGNQRRPDLKEPQCTRIEVPLHEL